MNLLRVHTRFQDQESCIEYLEKLRFGDEPFCPLCGCMNVARKDELDRVGRWNCHDCHSSFNVLSGTIFQQTRIPLEKWFMAICLTVNAKKSVSSCQLARDLDLNQKTAWYLQHRIRAAMSTTEGPLLQGIVEADETYVGGKPRKPNKRDDDEPKPRGRGTKKTPVIGVVERGGNVVAEVAVNLTGKGIMKFIRGSVNPSGSLLISDQYRAYNAVRKFMPHAVINHSVSYADGLTHTNTIEGFWSLLKRAWYGTHHHYRVGYMPLYVAEACWKYNQRKNGDAFGTFLRGCMA